MNSILNSVKSLLGIAAEDTAFDADIVVNINMAFATLNQLGVGPEQCYSITGTSDAWTDFSTDTFTIGLLRSYVYLKVKLLFDPPSASNTLDSMTKVLSELEWRLYVESDTKKRSALEV